MILRLTEQDSARPEAPGRPLALNLDAMDGDDARGGRLLAETLMKSRQPRSVTNPRARDTVEYTLTIEHEGGTETYTSDATSVSREFAELLKWIKVHLAEQRRRGGGA